MKTLLMLHEKVLLLTKIGPQQRKTGRSISGSEGTESRPARVMPAYKNRKYQWMERNESSIAMQVTVQQRQF